MASTDNFLDSLGSAGGVHTRETVGTESERPSLVSNLSVECRNRLHDYSDEAQKLRRSLVRGTNVLIIQGGYAGKRFIYDRLKQLGIRVTIMDVPDSCWKGMFKQGVIADFLPVDFTDHASVFERAMKVVGEKERSGVKFDACTTYYEDAVSSSARISTAMGLATNPVQACEKARNKALTRATLSAAGLPTPKFRLVHELENLFDACAFVGFPAILKPAFGAASIGVSRVDNLKQAVDVYKRLIPNLDGAIDSIFYQGTDCIVEEYYDGDEFDVDLLLSFGEVSFAKVSDNWACWAPYFQETGTNCPSLYKKEKQAELIDLAISSTLALGFKNGCFHVELKYTSRGPRLIEVNARMGGVSVREVNLTAWGVDLVEEHVMSALRIPIRPVVPEKPLKYIAECALNAPYSGTVNKDNWLDFVFEDQRVHKVNYFKKKGDTVTGPEDGLPDWIAEILVVSNDSQDEACQLIKKIVKEKAPVPITARVPGSERKYFFPDDQHPFTTKEE